MPQGELFDEWVDVELDDPRGVDGPPTRPPSTEVVADDQAPGVTLTVPAAGVGKGSKGLFGFGVIWNGFLVVFSAFVVPEVLADGVAGLALGAIGVFWVVGIGMILGALNMGLRSAVLAVADDRLTIEQRGLFGAKRREWARHEVKTICSGASGLEVNRVPILELQVFDTSNRKHGVLAGRDHGELEWMASELSRALGLEPC
jgi:hypothetical protein